MSAPRYMGEHPYQDGVCGACRWYALWHAAPDLSGDGECNAPEFSKRTGSMSRGMQNSPDRECPYDPSEWERRVP